MGTVPLGWLVAGIVLAAAAPYFFAFMLGVALSGMSSEPTSLFRVLLWPNYLLGYRAGSPFLSIRTFTVNLAGWTVVFAAGVLSVSLFHR